MRSRVLILAAVLSSSSAHADSVLAGSVAVLPFTDISATPGAGAEWIGESLAEALRESLAARGLPVIPRTDTMAAFADLRLRTTAELTQASVLKLGQSLNADKIVYGTFRPEGGGIAIRAVVSDRGRALLSPEIEESGPLAELDRVEAHLNWRALSWISPAQAPPEAAFRSLRPAVRVAAEESFIRGWISPAGEQREKFYEQATRTDTQFARPMLELGKIELARKNYKVAAEWLAKVDAANLHFAEATFYLGVAKFRLNDYVAAQAAFERIVSLLPAPEVWNNLGVAESRRGQLHALSSFREALEADPSHPDYHFNMGFMLFKTGQFEAAADRFRAVLDRNPTDQMATTLLGRSLKGEALRKGNSTDARFETAERFKDTYEELLSRTEP